MTRSFFVAAVVAAAGAGAAEPPAEVDLPRAELLGDKDVRTYLLVFHTGQEVMKGLLAFARKHKLTGGQVTGIGAVSSAGLRRRSAGAGWHAPWIRNSMVGTFETRLDPTMDRRT